jgi:hypothetical protein
VTGDFRESGNYFAQTEVKAGWQHGVWCLLVGINSKEALSGRSPTSNDILKQRIGGAPELPDAKGRAD